MSAKLYEISADIRMIGLRLAQGIDDDGEIPTDIAEDLDALQESFDAKAEGVCCIRAEMLGEAAMYKAEIDRLQKLHDAVVRRAEWLKAYLKQCLEVAGVEKLKTRLHRIAIVKNSRPSISLADGAEIPVEFKRVREEFDGQAAYEQWREWNAAMKQWEAASGKAEGLDGDCSVSEECEAARVKVMELALPPVVEVKVGKHLRIS